MKKDLLFQIFIEGTRGNNYEMGQRVLDNDLVASLNIKGLGNTIHLDGRVISDDLFNEYHVKVIMETGRVGILSTYCSCQDFEHNGIKKGNYACEHIAACFFKAVDELVSHPLLESGEEASNIGGILSMLLADEDNKEEIKLDVYINRDSWSQGISAEFRIGLKAPGFSNLYVLKDVNQFLQAVKNNVSVEYGKNFILSTKNHKLSVKDRRLVDLIEVLSDMEGKNRYINRNAEKYIDGKLINIPPYMVREFCEIIKNHRVYLNEGFFSRPVASEILFKEPEVDFELKQINDSYVLKSPGGMPISLGSRNDVLLYGTTLYLPNYEFCCHMAPFIKLLNQAKSITIPACEEERLLRKLIPRLHVISSNVILSKSILERIVMAEVGFGFYLDISGREVSLDVKVRYGSHEFNIFSDIEEKVIYRDSKKEQQVLAVVRNMGFEEIHGRFYLDREEDYIFSFLKNDLSRFQEMGEVYYSENFKGIKSVGTKGIKGDVRAGKYNYFEMDFKIGDISSEETAKILRAFRNNLRYYRLKSGEFLDLEELELKKFLKLIDMVSPDEIEGNHIEIPKSRGIYLESYLEEKNIRYIKGRDELKEIRNKLNYLERIEFKEPTGLTGTLREYQKAGYNWLKTLDYLGFGGILGDEMGLGKTIQAISFILSNNGSKTLIVAPTSLVYNWIGEFEKFSPTVKAVPVNGAREEREVILGSIDRYDVLVTTYNLLKRDMEYYKEMEFDFCILDEAQNIKNPGSQNAAAVKEIKAGTRFALTGTPIENSLMELWSIFDFIMPGYLFDEKRFSVRYHKRLNEEPEVIEELNRLIKPFILRRKKKDVIRELPDKIEKKFIVELDDEQRRVYGAYARYASELVERRVQEDEFKRSKIEILAYITRLRQLCLDPSVVMEGYSGGSSKIDALVELLCQSIEEGHRVLVFSQFTSVLKNISKRLEVEGITHSYLDGSLPSEKRMSMVKAFNRGENSVFLISLKAGGTGLNLTSADIVVHFDPWWNPAVEEQASDRAHRIGQKRVVEVIKLIAKGTIEEKVLALQEEKRRLIAQLMDDEMSKEDNLLGFTEEELLGLFQI